MRRTSIIIEKLEGLGFTRSECVKYDGMNLTEYTKGGLVISFDGIGLFDVMENDKPILTGPTKSLYEYEDRILDYIKLLKRKETINKILK
jgi:hypothetical protein